MMNDQETLLRRSLLPLALLVGDVRHDSWTRAYGLAPAARLAEMIEELLKQNGVPASEGEGR